MSRTIALAHADSPVLVTSVECEPLAELARPVRDFVQHAVLRLNATPDVAETTRLLVGELFANAVTHSRSSALVRVELRHDPARNHVVISVEDHGTGHAVIPDSLQHPSPDAESGRGLVLIRALAANCGVTPNPHNGNRVWFSLTLS